MVAPQYIIENIEGFEYELETLIGRCARYITDDEIAHSLVKAREGLEKSPLQLAETKHGQIRDILERYGCAEIGDSIVDEFCHLFGIPDTNVGGEE